MSYFRYYKEKQDADGERLWWPGGPDGFPFRGPQPPQTTQEEFENLRPSGKPRCKLFYLSNPDDMREYLQVRDKCVNGAWILIDRERMWDEESKNYRIFLEWVEIAYDTVPTEGMRDAVKQYTQQAQGVELPYGKLAGIRSNQGW